MEVLAQILVRAIFAFATVILFLVAGFASLIAIAGTGGFTSDPPPQQPHWIGLLVIMGGWTALQWTIARLQKAILGKLDRIFDRTTN